MIRTARTNHVSPHVERRSQTMTVERLSPTLFRVIPSEPGKKVRIVKFHYDESDRDCGIECYHEDSGEGCAANDHARLCAHIHRAISELLKQNSE